MGKGVVPRLRRILREIQSRREALNAARTALEAGTL
jgi:hypothetical protein